MLISHQKIINSNNKNIVSTFYKLKLVLRNLRKFQGDVYYYVLDSAITVVYFGTNGLEKVLCSSPIRERFLPYQKRSSLLSPSSWSLWETAGNRTSIAVTMSGRPWSRAIFASNVSRSRESTRLFLKLELFVYA